MDTVTINRAPVLTLWAAVVAERLGSRSRRGAYAWQVCRRTDRTVEGKKARDLYALAGGYTPAASGEGESRGRVPRRAPGPGSACVAHRRGPKGSGQGPEASVPCDRREIPRSEVRRSAPRRAACDGITRKVTGPRGVGRGSIPALRGVPARVPAGESGWGAKGTLNLKKIEKLERRT